MKSFVLASNARGSLHAGAPTGGPRSLNRLTATFEKPARMGVTALAVLAIWGAPVSQAWAAASAQQVNELQRLIASGKATDALKRIEQSLKDEPNDANWRFLRAMALAETGRQADAIKVYQKLIEDRPELPGPRNNLAVLYAQKGQFDKARLTLEGALRSHPVYAVAYDNLGDVHARLASQSYAKALQLSDVAPPPAPALTAVRDLGSPIVMAGAGGVQAAPTVAAPVAPVPAPAPAPAAAPAPAPVPVPPPVVTPPAAAKPAAKPEAKPEAPLDTKIDTAKADKAKADAAKAEAAKADSARADMGKASVQVRDAVTRWAGAWSRQDMDAYFAAYHPNFNGGKGSRSAWMKDRRARILGKSDISVTVGGLVVDVEGDRAEVQFRQRYRSDRLDADTKKKMRLVRMGNRWVIDRESAGS